MVAMLAPELQQGARERLPRELFQSRRIHGQQNVVQMGQTMKMNNQSILSAAVLPLRLVILSSLAEPPALILASRRSRRKRAACCAGDSSADDMKTDDDVELRKGVETETDKVWLGSLLWQL
jgi:hypothetical protein